MISLITPIIGFFLFGIILSYLLCFFSERLFINRKNKTIDYIEFKRTGINLKDVLKNSLYAAIFTFNISYQILKIPNLVNYFVNDEYALGEVNPLIYSYFAILPIMFFISGAIYSAIWLLTKTDLYISIKIEKVLIDRHNISNFYGNLLKNYTTISTFFMIILITRDYYLDLTSISIDFQIIDILLFPSFVFFVSPLYFFPLVFLVENVNPLKKKKKRRIS
jgi:hypothetical protein